MANFEFFLSKAVELRHRANAIRSTLNRVNSRHHPEMASLISVRLDKVDDDINRIEQLVLTGNSIYLPRIATKHRLCEKEARSLADSVGIILREGPTEETVSKLLKRLCHECGFSVNDFLVCFFSDGPAIGTFHERNPIFYVRDECLSSSYSWLPLYHEIGHAVVRQHWRAILEPLVLVVRDYYSQVRASIGPIPQGPLNKQHRAIAGAEDYWTRGENVLRLNELFCDCFATYATGIAYPYYWVDFGASFVEDPKFIYENDNHPPFLARLEACFHVLPDIMKNSDHGKMLVILASDYLSSIPHSTNPELEYGTVCHPALIEKLAGRSMELIGQYWSHLQQYQTLLSAEIAPAPDATIACLLNALVAALLAEPTRYPACETEILQRIYDQ